MQIRRFHVAMAWAVLSVGLAGVAGAADAGSAPAGAQAGDRLEEVVVTAQRRTENLQKVSIAIATVSGEDIDRQSLNQADEVLKNVPGVVVQGAARGLVIAIRGLGSDLPPGVGESAVSTNFDGVYNYRAESGLLGYYDLDRVEILRGPQGTLYGRNATGGVVNVQSRNPGRDFGGNVSLEGGNYSLYRVAGAVNAPLGADWAVRASGVSINRKGYSNNGGNDAVGAGGRLKALYKPSEDFSLLLSGEYTHLGGEGNSGTPAANFLAGQPYTNAYSSAIFQDYRAYKFSAQLDATAGPGTVTFIPSYQHGAGVVGGDMGMGLEIGKDPIAAVQKSAELRYASLPSSPVTWVAGVYYYSLDTGVDMGQGASYDHTKSSAVFGQVSFPVAEGTRVLLGAREAQDKKGYENVTLNPPVNSSTSSAFDWKAGVEHDVSATSMAYATLASGHRPGGFNSFPGAGASFEQESLKSLELGSKNRFLDNRLQVNGDVFYYDYKNYQASDFFFPAGSPFPQLFIYNTGKVKNYGAELDVVAAPSKDDRLNAGVTYLHSRYGSQFQLHDGPNVADMYGEALPHAPDWSLKAGYEHVFQLGGAGTLIARLDGRYVSKQFVAPYPGAIQVQDAYATGDISLDYNAASKRWDVNAYVKNVNDKALKTAYFAGEFIVGNPRLYGAVLNVRF